MISKHIKTIATASVLVSALTLSAYASGVNGANIPEGKLKLLVPANLPAVLTAAPELSTAVDSENSIVFSNLIELKDGVSDADFEYSEGQRIVDTAMQYLGTPYVWGGTTEKGFDCSGFVQYVYKECGYTIDRTAAQIYKNGTYVEKANLENGDAICFSSHTESIGHVGIYIGNGQFIHASSGSGAVIISELSEDYYTARYVGARHIV